MPNRLATATRAAFLAAALASVAPAALRGQDTLATRDAVRSAPATVKHTVKPGDTLWDIAKYYLKDPFKWPQVFHANTDIVKNPHWIYPGQVLTIDGDAVKPEIAAQASDAGVVVAQIQTRAQEPTVFATAEATTPRRAVRSTTIPPALTVRPGEYEAAPYVVSSKHSTRLGKVIGAVDIPALGLSSDAGFKLFDRIYVSLPANGSAAVGDRVIVARDGTEIPDIGRVVEPTGVLRIDSVAGPGRAIAVIERQFGTITPGEGIFAPGQSFEATSTRPVRGDYPLTAKLVWIQGAPRLPSVQAYVVLGASESQGVKMGDQFTLLDDRSRADGRPAPVEGTATVTIVRVTSIAATGIVVSQMQPEIRVGMPTRLSAKMP